MKIERLSAPNMLRIVADLPGPNVVIFAGIHGDEPSGVHAIHKLVYDFTMGNHTLNRGTLTLAVANEEALLQDKRYLEHNLNRIFDDDLTNDGSTYELQRARELMPLLNPSVDYFLDLHSICSETTAYAVCEAPNIAYARQLGIPKIAIGWADCCTGTMQGDTDNYAQKYGALSLTYEAGQHYDYTSIQNATLTVFRLLVSLEMLNAQSTFPPVDSEVFRFISVRVKQDDSFTYTKQYRNFEPVAEGEVIAYERGIPIVAPQSAYITLVNLPERTRIGDDVFFLAEAIQVEMLAGSY